MQSKDWTLELSFKYRNLFSKTQLGDTTYILIQWELSVLNEGGPLSESSNTPYHPHFAWFDDMKQGGLSRQISDLDFHLNIAQ